MTGLLRQGHFLGSKLRTLRKRNGLTLEELSSRCVQLDASNAPSVSYLSMVETGKRIPSADMLGVLAAVFGKEAIFYYGTVIRRMWFHEPVDLGETTTRRIPAPLVAAMAITTTVVLVIGVYPQLFAKIGDLAFRST